MSEDVIKARLADGRELTFPVGTDPAVIQRTVKNVLRAGNIPPIPQPQGIPQPKRTTGQGLAEVAASAVDMAPFGLGSEAGAVTQTLLGQAGIGDFPPTLEENLEQNRRILEQSDPTARTIGQVVGAVPAGFAFGAPQSVAQASRQGTVLGTGFGAGATEGGLPERAIGAGVGALTGAGTAAAGQAIIQGISRAIANARTGLDTPTRRAMDQVLEELREGNITPQQAINRVERLGPEGVLADLPELRALAGDVATRSAAGGRVAESAMRGRRLGGEQRTNQALDAALGGRNTREARQAAVSGRKQQAGDLYDAALNRVNELQRTPELEALIGTPGVKGSGSRRIRNELRKVRDDDPAFRDLPDTDPNLLHEVRVALADKTKGQGQPKRRLNRIVQQLTDAMEGAGATGYREAVDQYRTDSLMIEAFDQGFNSFKQLPEDVNAFLQAAGPGQRDMFVAGLGRRVAADLATGETKAASLGVRSVLRGERAKVLQETLGDDAYNQLRNRLLREIEFAGTEQRALRGTQTQPREAAAERAQQRLNRGRRAMEAIRGGRGAQAALLETALGSRSPASRVAEETALAQLLFRSQGQGLAPGRFESRSPLVELALRQRLLQGGSRLTAPARKPSVGLAGAAAAQAAANNPLLGSGF